jgi:cytoskeleton protein RodZ
MGGSMSDQETAVDPGRKSAGTMLREARQARGVHIAALSVSIKVSQRKLELLEQDRLSELPDATFARALAQTMCRSLKIDPAPVLAALPPTSGYRLESVDEGIKLPFHERPGRYEPASWSVLLSPAVWVPALIVVGAVFVYLMPEDWVERLQGTQLTQDAPPAVVQPAASAVQPVVETASAAAVSADASAPLDASVEPNAADSMVETVHSVPDAVAMPEPAASALGTGPLQMKATEPSWVEVVDSRSQILLSRVLQPGETVVLDGAMPLRVKVGNSAGTQLSFKGVPVDLAASTRDNVARLELK